MIVYFYIFVVLCFSLSVSKDKKKKVNVLRNKPRSDNFASGHKIRSRDRFNLNFVLLFPGNFSIFNGNFGYFYVTFVLRHK